MGRATTAGAPAFDMADLDIGIRESVALLREFGFETTDSGDGESKAYCGEPDNDCQVHNLDFPHVAARSTPETMCADAVRMQALLREKQPDGLADWTVEATFVPGERGCVLFARASRPKDWSARKASLWRAIRLYGSATGAIAIAQAVDEVNRAIAGLINGEIIRIGDAVRDRCADVVECFRENDVPAGEATAAERERLSTLRDEVQNVGLELKSLGWDDAAEEGGA